MPMPLCHILRARLRQQGKGDKSTLPVHDTSCLRLILAPRETREPLTGTPKMPDSGGGRIETIQVVQGPESSVIAPVFSSNLNGYMGARPA